MPDQTQQLLTIQTHMSQLLVQIRNVLTRMADQNAVLNQAMQQLTPRIVETRENQDIASQRLYNSARNLQPVERPVDYVPVSQATAVAAHGPEPPPDELPEDERPLLPSLNAIHVD